MEYALSSTLCYTKHMQPSQFDQSSASDAADPSRTARVVVVVLFAISIFLFKSYTFALLIPIMAVALIVSLQRPAALLNYSASHAEVVVGQRTYSYDTFRSFSVTAKPTQNWITLIPRKRFAMPIVMYFPEDVGEQLVDLIASHLPMSERKPDLLERLIIYLRLQ